ncbi:MAG TPA: hypothetical protein PKC69_01800 [Chitinophagaceae bacterium]|nr:hypothetical protein [Chitinophagaceae bacterium]
MRKKLSEKNVVVVLFAFTIFFFSLAQRDTVKQEKIYRHTAAAPVATPQTAQTDLPRPALLATE